MGPECDTHTLHRGDESSLTIIVVEDRNDHLWKPCAFSTSHSRTSQTVNPFSNTLGPFPWLVVHNPGRVARGRYVRGHEEPPDNQSVSHLAIYLLTSGNQNLRGLRETILAVLRYLVPTILSRFETTMECSALDTFFFSAALLIVLRTVDVQGIAIFAICFLSSHSCHVLQLYYPFTALWCCNANVTV